MKILIGVDFSDESLDAARQGFALARHLSAEGGACEVLIAHIVGSGARHPTVGVSSLLEDADNRRKIEAKVDEFLADLEEDSSADSPPYTLLLEEGRAREKLAEIAKRVGADWLFVGRSGSGALVRLVLGSTSQTLAHNPPCQLAIAHERAPDWQKTPQIGVALDFSAHSERALLLGIKLAKQSGAKLHLLHVVYPVSPVVPVILPERGVSYRDTDYLEAPAMLARAEADMAQLEESFAERLSGTSWSRQVLAGYPSRELVSYAEDNHLDALLMGTVGRSAFDNFLLGSVADAVVKHAPCTIYLTPPGD